MILLKQSNMANWGQETYYLTRDIGANVCVIGPSRELDLKHIASYCEEFLFNV